MEAYPDKNSAEDCQKISEHLQLKSCQNTLVKIDLLWIMKNTGEKRAQLMSEQKIKWVRNALNAIFLCVR